MSRGLRNNNPLNIRRNATRWKGLSAVQKDSAFFCFDAPCWGYRAAFVTLKNYERLHGLATLCEWIARWAPPVENDTAAYTAFVSKKTGIGVDAHIDTADKELMCRIVAAMSQMENGAPAVAADVEEGWKLSCDAK